jgi:hypothetical protein
MSIDVQNGHGYGSIITLFSRLVLDLKVVIYLDDQFWIISLQGGIEGIYKC